MTDAVYKSITYFKDDKLLLLTLVLLIVTKYNISVLCSKEKFIIAHLFVYKYSCTRVPFANFSIKINFKIYTMLEILMINF